MSECVRTITYPEYRWDLWSQPSIRDGRGPERVDASTPDPEFKRRPVGFTADIEDPAPVTLTWDGDDS